MATDATSAYPWDISIGGVGLMLEPDRDQRGQPLPEDAKSIDGQFSPVDNNDQPSDQPVLWPDWSLGMGLPTGVNSRGGYAFALNAYTRRRGKAMPAPRKIEADLPLGMADGVTIVDIKPFGSDLYLLTSGNQIIRVNAGDTSSIDVAETSGISGFAGQSLQPWRGELLASGLQGVEILRSGTWQPFSAPMGKLGTVSWFSRNQPTRWLLSVWDTYGFRKTDGDPSTWVSSGTPGAWSFYTAIADETYPVTGICTSNRAAVFGTPGGLASVDSSGYSPILTEHWTDLIDSRSGSVMTRFNNKVFANHAGLIDRVNVQNYQIIDDSDYVHPGLNVESTGPIFGDVTAMTPDRGWLSAALDNGSDSFLCFGKDPQALKIDINLPFIWHGAEAWWENQYVTAMTLSTVGGRNRMWVATYDRIQGRARLWTIGRYKSADAYQAWQQGEEIEFERYWSVTHLGESYGDPSARKVPRRGDVTSENLGSEVTLQIFARIDQTQPVELDDDGNDQYSFIPPVEGEYTLTLGDYGTTAALDGYSEASAATSDDILTALEALDAELVGAITVSGTISPFVITVPHGEALSVSRGTLDWWLQGIASTSTRQTFLPSDSVNSGFDVQMRIDGFNTIEEPAIATSVKLRSSVLQDQIETKVYTVRFAKHQQLLKGIDDRDQETVKSQLEAFMGSGLERIIDESNRVAFGKVEGGFRYKKRKRRSGWEYAVTFRVSILKRPFYWDSDARWDDVFVWSAP